MPGIDFTTFTEVDPGADITVAASKVTFTNVLGRQDTFYVYKDMGAGYFNGDFTHRFEIEFSSVGDGTLIDFWGLANSINDRKGVVDASEDGIYLWVFDDTESVRLGVIEDGVQTSDEWSQPGPQANTTYYITVTRDDGGGVNGTGRITAEIRTGSHAGALQDTLTVDCGVGEQNDFRYLYAGGSYDDNSTANTASGFIQNLDAGIMVNDSTHAMSSDQPAIVQILSILSVNDSTHLMDSDSPLLIILLVPNDAAHALSSDQPLIIIILEPNDSDHLLSSDSPALVFLPPGMVNMTFVGQIPGIVWTGAVPEIELKGQVPSIEFGFEE
ncbi:hypothetical protein LCGC14_0814170 [marine sediment metagenome]|uniref:Uncharacterized protein n=1 Tax=marine sediment metagenome TaxID=412755 RepID=A0A0F9PQB4_9ZZZZ